MKTNKNAQPTLRDLFCICYGGADQGDYEAAQTLARLAQEPSPIQADAFYLYQRLVRDGKLEAGAASALVLLGDWLGEDHVYDAKAPER